MKRILNILPALALLAALLAGCAEAEEKTVVARVGGEPIYMSEVEAKSAPSEMMFSSLTGISEEELNEKRQQVRQAVLEELIMERVLLQKAAELGITETPELRAAAEAGWESTVTAMTDYVLKSYPTLEGEELDETVDAMLKSQGLDRETAIENGVKTEIINELLDQVKRELPPPGESDLRAAYDELAASQQAAFAAGAEALEAALLAGDTVVYIPEPCRVVQSAYFKFDDDVIGLLKQLDSVGDTETQEEMRNDQYALMDAEVQSAVRKLETGGDFAEIQDQWPPSGALTNYFTENTTRFSEEILSAVWSLENEGDWTAPIKSEYGYYIYYWLDTLEEGEIPLEDVREKLIESLTEQRQKAAVEATKALWRGEADVEIYS